MTSKLLNSDDAGRLFTPEEKLAILWDWRLEVRAQLRIIMAMLGIITTALIALLPVLVVILLQHVK